MIIDDIENEIFGHVKAFNEQYPGYDKPELIVYIEQQTFSKMINETRGFPGQVSTSHLTICGCKYFLVSTPLNHGWKLCREVNKDYL